MATEEKPGGDVNYYMIGFYDLINMRTDLSWEREYRKLYHPGNPKNTEVLNEKKDKISKQIADLKEVRKRLTSEQLVYIGEGIENIRKYNKARFS